ncbi:MAG: hypothetical protein JNL21_09535 [Myxococcales bacterium]|nr:hypothetical protein [Myxococcales bacterium]
MIDVEFARQQPAGRFLVKDPSTIANGVTTDLVRWSCAPAEPESCFGTSVARALSDWGWRGRQELHNEYAEYSVIYRFDSAGRRRPKRVEITTELREYWVMVATEQPEVVRQMATAVLGSPITMEDLYGDDVGNVDNRSKLERQARFSYYTAGSGGSASPAQPQGWINRERALFMTHPINGLDDLIYIVAFGAHPYAVRTPNGHRRASLEEVFIANGVEYLYCRHADPAAAAGAHKQAYEGRQVAFANPLGVYIQSFAKSRFFVVDTDQDVPDAWVKPSRGKQRLEFGPPDDDPHFLDDIAFEIGGDIHRLSGGFDVVAAIEVGPNLVVGDPSDVTEADLAPYVLPAGTGGTIRCGESARCEDLATFKAAYEAAHPIGMGPQTPRG